MLLAALVVVVGTVAVRVFFCVVFSVEDLMFVRVTLLVVSDWVTLAVVLVVVEVSLARVAKGVGRDC